MWHEKKVVEKGEIHIFFLDNYVYTDLFLSFIILYLEQRKNGQKENLNENFTETKKKLTFYC